LEKIKGLAGTFDGSSADCLELQWMGLVLELQWMGLVSEHNRMYGTRPLCQA